MQVVLQVVDENVARGSKVFETGHVSPFSLKKHSAEGQTHVQQLLCGVRASQPLVRCAVAVQILVLGFCDSQRDLEVVQKILSQARAQARFAFPCVDRTTEHNVQSVQGAHRMSITV